MAEKEYEDDDPMYLNGVVMKNTDTELQVRTLIEEFILCGYSKDELFSLFTNPFYQGANFLYRKVGKEHIEEIINEYIGKIHWNSNVRN